MSVQQIIDELRKDEQTIKVMVEANIVKGLSVPEAWLSQVPDMFRAEKKKAENFVKANYGWFILGAALGGFVLRWII